MKQPKRDVCGAVIDGPIQKIKSWLLGRKLRQGKVPRGRTISSDEARVAMAVTQRGELTEVWGFLSAVLIKASGERIDLGLISVRKITTAFRDYIVDSLQDSTTYPLSAFKHHASGTGTTAEANTQTALVTEVGSRAVGTQVEGATANIYRSVATITYSATYAITEHGLFSAAAAGTMMDRAVFGAINVDSSDSIQFTYEGTFNAEA